MHTLRAANSEPIPGYRLLEPLGRGGFGEVWKCEVPGGLHKAIKFVAGPGDHLDEQANGAERELRALQHIKTIRHPYLLAMDRVEMIDGDLVIVMELADKSLHDLMLQYRQIGLPGIPRDELLRYLREAAEILDLMNQEHGLQHLDIKPRNLFLVGQHIKVADFGLVTDLNSRQDCQADAPPRDGITPLYAAPETFLGKISPTSDQYSLAISYSEMVSGVLPFTGKNCRQVALAHVQGQPDLSGLLGVEAPILLRALARDPAERFPSAMDFVLALEAIGPGPALPPPRPRNTKLDICLGEMASTTTVPTIGHLTSSGTRPYVPPVAPSGGNLGQRSGGAATNGAAERGPTLAPPGGSYVPGYQLLECLGRLPIGEVWTAANANGDRRIIRLVTPPDVLDNDPENDPVRIVQQLRHPLLAPLEVFRCPGERLALVTDPGDGSLHDRLRECHRDSLPGIPRMELLGYLQIIAAGLDSLQQMYRIQHLGLTPRHIFLYSGEVRLVEFGLMELFWVPAGYEAPALNTRYCAPELFSRQSSRSCDQYSLALIYQELLTGVHAFRNLNQRQMATARLRGNPDVGLLPAMDRPIVLKALSINPDQRFRSSTEFLAALEAVSYDIGRPVAAATRTLGATMPNSPAPFPTGPRAPAGSPATGRPGVAPDRAAFGPDPRIAKINEAQAAVAAEVATVAGKGDVRMTASLRYTLHAEGGMGDGEPSLEASCFGRLLPATVRLKLEGFRDQWQAELIAADTPTDVPGKALGVSFAFFIRVSASLWQRCIGHHLGIEVNLTLKPPSSGGESLTEVRVRMLPHSLGGERAAAILADMGPKILESLKDYLQLHTERRGEQRFAYPKAVQIYPVLPSRDLGGPILAQGKDISTRGMALYLPCQLPTASIYIQFAPPNRVPVAVPAHIIRADPCPDGRIEAGVCFAWEEIV
jgi:serine/threonine protein kinase